MRAGVRVVTDWRQNLHHIADSLGDDEGRALAVIASRLHRDATLYRGCHAEGEYSVAWLERTQEALADSLVGVSRELVRRQTK